MASYTLKEAAGGAWANAAKGKVQDALRAGLLSAGYKIVENIQTALIPTGGSHPPISGRGIYKAAWRVKKSDRGVDIYNTSPQAVFIEYGVRAGSVKIGRAMISALAAWVRMKGIGGKTVVSRSGKESFRKPGQDEAESIAWAIAKNMQKKGIFNVGGFIPGKNGLRVLEYAVKTAISKGVVAREIQDEIKRRLGKP